MIRAIRTYSTRIVATLIIVVIGSFALFAQTAQLPTYIKTNMILEQGSYEVMGTVYVAKEVTLTVKPGANLVFHKDATVRVDGALEIKGEPNNLVNVTSKDSRNPGNGFVIDGVSTNQDVTVNYARFEHIKKPISFEFRWSRKTVDFSHNVIRNSWYEGAAVQIRDIDNLLTLNKIYFTIKNNTFSNNSSSILISNITSDLLTVNFEENVLTRNEYTGRSRNGIFTSPLYLTYNQYQQNDVPKLITNSVFDNFYSLYYEDTFSVGRTNLSIIGNADNLDVGGNYFGDPELREIEESFDFISANYQAPFLFADDKLNVPPSFLNGHFYEAYVNGEVIDERLLFSAYNGQINDVQLRFNRPVAAGEDFGVLYHFLSGDSIKTVKLKSSLKWTEGNQYVKININEKLKAYGLKGYLEIDGFYDSNDMDVPILNIGKKALIDAQFRTYVPYNKRNLDNIRDADVSKDDTLIPPDPNDVILVRAPLPDSLVHVLSKYPSLGFFVGNAIYFGDLNRTVVSVSPRNMTPAVGVRYGYQFSEKFNMKVSTNAMIIRGSDRPLNDKNNNVRGTNFNRNLSFRTTIIDAGLLAEYNLLKYKFKSTYVPSVHAGVNAYYFKPMAQVENDNQWYDLRSIGTGGQTINGADQAYKKIMYGIPMGASIKRHISQKLILNVSYTYTKIFTDYLDDVAVDYYPDPTLLTNANPEIEADVINKLANPGNQSLKAQRSYSDDRDGYGYWGIGITMKLYN